MISGYVCVRNGIELDYCWRQAVQSLLPVCDEVLICDGESTDGTYEEACHLALGARSKVRVIRYPWVQPWADVAWMVRWMNFARERLLHPWQLYLDADEVLDPGAVPGIMQLLDQRRAGSFQRLNYWNDPHHLAPRDRVCAPEVARFGPSNVYMPMDDSGYSQQFHDPTFRPNVSDLAQGPMPLGLVIHHYGFLRKSDAFVAKTKIVQGAFFGTVDERIADTAAAEGDWRRRDYFDGAPLVPYTGGHPDVILPWLRDRGYDV